MGDTSAINLMELMEDYLAHQVERDNEYSFEKYAGLLMSNIKSLEPTTSEEDWALLESEIAHLMSVTLKEGWKGKSFEVILHTVTVMQQEKLLSLHEVVEVLASVKWTAEQEIGTVTSKKDWIEAVFKDFGVELKNVERIAKEIEPYPLHVLNELFSNLKSIDEHSTVEYFKALNAADFNFDMKLELLQVMTTAQESFEEAKVPLYYMMVRQLLEPKGFLYDDSTNIFKNFDQLVGKGWSIVDFYNISEKVLKKCSIGQEFGVMSRLVNSLNMARDYSIEKAQFIATIDQSIASHPSRNDFEDIEKKLHEKALKKFGETKVKSLHELLSELASSNGWQRTNMPTILRQKFNEVMKATKSSSNLIGKVVDSCTNDDIKLWIQKFHETSKKPQQAERIAFVMKSFSLFKGYTLRDVQVLSILMLYKPEAGTLAQINTSEGKTAIIAVLASLFVLEGKNVDVVTSSPELATPQAAELKPFYSGLGITSSDLVVGNKKEAYKCQVLYGSIDEYEADVLRDEYSNQGTRSNRPFQIALVDEVDSMLIDGKNFMVRLASPMPGMNELEPILAAIWIHLDMVASRIYEEDGKAFYVENPDDIESFVPLDMSKLDFVTKNVSDHARLLLRDRARLSKENRFLVADYPEMEIPNYLKDFVLENRIEKWINNAIRAKFYYVNGRDYIIQDKKIRIVDVNNTGVVHENMTWSDGLHQFLQMKHGAKMSSEQMTTNFIANPTYFMRYRKNIYGLSGTLGSKVAQDFLKETYNVQLIVVPPFKMKLHIALSPIISPNEDEWREAIVSSSIDKLRNNRPCLIIAESINEAKLIEKVFLNKFYPKNKILMYTTEKSRKVIEKEIAAGEVIISTNIAGRGTDIKLTKAVNKNGGLHLCLTFLPINDRVELQNLGRTSRTGNPGTSQFVLLDPLEKALEELQKKRDEANEAAFKSAAKDMKKIIMRARVFQKFCISLAIVRGAKKPPSDWGTVNKNGCTDIAVAEATEERFGFWLKSNEDQISNPEEYMQKFEQFEKNIKSDASRGSLVRNPFYYVNSGNDSLNQKNYEEAEDQFTKAISLDDKFAANAYYNRAYTLMDACGDSSKTEKVDQAISDFRRARVILEKRKTDLQMIQQACTSGDLTELAEQVNRKCQLLDIQIAAINRAVGYDKDLLQRQIDEATKHRIVVLARIENFVPKEKLKSEYENAQKLYETLQQKYSNGDGELDQMKAKVDGLHNKLLSFQSKEDLQNSIKDIDTSISETTKNMNEKGVIVEARSNDNGVKINLVKLDDILVADKKTFDDDIYEFERNGYLGSFEVSEIPPVDWWAVIGVMLIGLAQMVAGAAIAIFSCGAAASFGLGMILEGVSDVVTAVRDGIINKNFSWKNWGVMKAISYTVSIVCAGLSALKNIVSTAITAARGAIKTGTAILTGTVKEGWKLAAKKIGLELGKGIARELVTTAISYGLDATLVVGIEQQINDSIRSKIEAALLNDPTVKKMLQLDEINKNHKFEELIMGKAMQILQTPATQNLLRTYALGVSEGIASQKKRGIAAAIDIAQVLLGVREALVFVDEFMVKLKASLKTEAAKANVDQALEKANATQSNKNMQKKSEGGNRQAEGSINPEQDIDLSNGQNEEIVTSDYQKSDQSNLVNKIALHASKNISAIVKGQVLMPGVRTLSNYGVGKLSKSLDAALNKHIDLYQSRRRLIQSANNDRDNLLGDVYKQNHLNPVNMKKVEELVKNVKSGDELGLVHMGALAEITGQRIVVRNEKDQILYNVGEAQKGQKPIEVQYHPPSTGWPQGHWTLPGKTEAITVGAGKNDCLLNVICDQAPHVGTPLELRSKLASSMETNKTWLANAMPDYEKLERNMKAGLYEGGAAYPQRTGTADTVRELIDYSHRNPSHNHGNLRGHPRGHISIPNAAPNRGAGTSVQNYSYNRHGVPNQPEGKSALGSAQQTYSVMNAFLKTPTAREAFARLNGNQAGRPPSDVTTIDIRGAPALEIVRQAGINPNTLRVNTWLDGNITNTQTFDGYRFVLRHRVGEQNNPNARVYIQTAFPYGGVDINPNVAVNPQPPNPRPAAPPINMWTRPPAAGAPAPQPQNNPAPGAPTPRPNSVWNRPAPAAGTPAPRPPNNPAPSAPTPRPNNVWNRPRPSQ